MTPRPKIRKTFERERYTVDLTGQEMKTDTSMGNDTDVNNIVARFKRDGIMPEGTGQNPQYGDVSALQGDLTEIIAKGETAKQELEKLQNDQIKANKEQAEQNKNELQRLQALEKEMLEKQTLNSENGTA